MLSMRMLGILCIALAMLSSRAFGVIVEIEVNPKAVAEHKDKSLDVNTAKRPNGSVEFRITRSVPEGKYCSGEIVIRKGGHEVVRCQVEQVNDKSRVSFVFTVSPDYRSESDFIMSEGNCGDVTLEFPNGKTKTSKERSDERRLHLSLRDFVNYAGDSK
ncbi:MAG: hypothetical protein ACLP9L_34340 [Thermoguttaceae bacterium]